MSHFNLAEVCISKMPHFSRICMQNQSATVLESLGLLWVFMTE